MELSLLDIINNWHFLLHACWATYFTKCFNRYIGKGKGISAVIGESGTVAAEVWKSIVLSFHVAFSYVDKELKKNKNPPARLTQDCCSWASKEGADKLQEKLL